MDNNLIECYSTYTKMPKDGIKAMFEVGAICERTALWFVIKTQYWMLLKTSDISTRSAIIHLSIEWNVSEDLVKKIIYKTPKIKA